MIWLAVGIVGYLLFIFWCWSLCRIAALADRDG